VRAEALVTGHQLSWSGLYRSTCEPTYTCLLLFGGVFLECVARTFLASGVGEGDAQLSGSDETFPNCQSTWKEIGSNNFCEGKRYIL